MNRLSETAGLDLTALLLCGGKGERMRPLTESVPKPLVLLRGQPLLHHLMSFLQKSGVRRFVLCVGHQAYMIQQFLANNCDSECDVRCLDSGDVTMTDRLLAAREYVHRRGLICYGDTLANVNLPSLIRRHEECGGLATVTVHPLHSPFGIVDMDPQGQVTGFKEKPRLPHWINIGFIVAELAAFDLMRPFGDMPEFLNALSACGQLYAFQHEGRHITINTEKDRSEAERNIISFYTRPSDELT